MLIKKDYILKNQLMARNDSVIYKAIREVDHQRILLKMPNNLNSYNNSASFYHEYELLKQINIPGVIHVHELLEEKIPILELEYVYGIGMNDFLKGKPLSLNQFFKIAKQIINIIGLLHEKKIIHKNIKPDSFIINPKSLQIKLIDLSISTKVSGIEQEFIHPNILEGTLAYLSPEQTGRLNNPIDYRTDFYSIGVTFFEILTGQLPFQSSDPLEMVYFQIAKKPPDVCDINPHLPKVIGKIINKLLEKIPEERYRSANGLKIDLEKCESQWLKNKIIDEFEIGLLDISDHLQISHTLYGREEQVKLLINNYEKVAQGEKNLTLVSGYSGIGKTALVHEVYKSITKYHGYYITGKYSQLQRGSPYFGFINAFQDLIKQLFASSPDTLKAEVDKLLISLGDSASNIVFIVPELKKLIGDQKSISFEDKQTEDQLNLAFKRLINGLASKEHPLVIFLDDLQWADTTSMKLLQYLVKEPDIKYLMIIGAYRDNEISMGHPLSVTVDYMQSINAPIAKIQLMPLQLENINELINDTFHCKQSLNNSLAKCLAEKTGGNPFFINEFLKVLYRSHIIKYSFSDSTWEWDITKIMELNVTDNVADLLTNEMKKLSLNTQKLLNIASCIGNQFSLTMLNQLTNIGAREILRDLWDTVDMGLIIPLGETYKLDMTTFNNNSVNGRFSPLVQFRFAHDRVQQAAYFLMSDIERKKIHLQIGYYLLKSSRNENIFNIVNQLNNSLDLLSREQIDEIIELNLIAGKKALGSAAAQPAVNYLKVSQGLADEDLWLKNHNLMFDIQLNTVIALFFNKQFDEVIELATKCLIKVTNHFEKATLYKYIVLVYHNSERYADEIAVGRLAFSALGIDIKEQVGVDDILTEYQKTEVEISKRQLEELPNLPKMKEPLQCEIMNLLKVIINAYYMTAPEFFPIIGCKMIQISLKYGNSPESAYAYCAYGLIKYSITGDTKDCYHWNKVGFETLNVLQDKVLASSVYFMSQYFGNVWKVKFADTIPLLLEGYKLGVENGDFLYACFSYHACIAFSFLMGKDINKTLLEAKDALKIIANFKQQIPYYLVELYYQVMNNLVGNTENPNNIYLRIMENPNKSLLLDESFDNKTIVCKGYTFKAMIAYLLGNFIDAFQYTCIGSRYLAANPGSPIIFYLQFFQTLSLLSLYSKENRETQAKYIEIIKTNLDKIKTCAEFGPNNFLSPYYILSAEYAYITEQNQEAAEYYDKAIVSADEQRNLYLIGIANECAARFYIAQNRIPIAEYYMTKAFVAYYDWGAIIKCKLLEAQFPKWFHLQISEQQLLSSLDTSISTLSIPINALDAITLLKSTRAIASEIQLDKLLRKMMTVILENIGADRGTLASYQDESWLIEISASFEDKEFIINQNPADLPLSLMNYVKNTRKALIVQSVLENDLVMSDPYVAKRQPKSLLIVPIFYKHKFRRLLYLENHITTNAFTAQQLYMLRMLISQIAISIENAKLFDSTTRFVPKPLLKILHKESVLDIKPGESIEKKVTVMFTDIRNYTHLSEQLTPQETFAFVNKYIKHMAPIIRKHHGFIVQYLGDAILSIFPKLASDAIHAALEMKIALDQFNRVQVEQDKPSIQVGFGINTGNAMLGLLGEEERVDTSVISDAINLASRLEGLNKIYGTTMLTSNLTVSELNDPSQFTLRVIDRVRVKGKSHPIDLYEIVLPVHTKEDAKGHINIELFLQAFDNYKQNDFSKAYKYFSEYLKNNPEDKPAQILNDRCKLFIEKGAPLDWDGSFTMLVK